MGKKRKKTKYKLKINDIQEAEFSHNGKIELNLPPVTNLPSVSVVTITKNRSKHFQLAIYNWKNFLYPKDKIEWVIVDDSDDNTLETAINELHDPRINYMFTHRKFKNVAVKRNFAVENSSGEVIVNMDDDDYHYSDSILAKIRCLQKYNKKCVFSIPIGVYNLNNNTSQIINTFDDIPGIPEATLAFYRSFWDSGSKFSFRPNCAGEGLNMIWRQDKHLLKIPYFFNCICFTHKNNITGSMRNMSIPGNKLCMNFMDLFPGEVKNIIHVWQSY